MNGNVMRALLAPLLVLAAASGCKNRGYNESNREGQAGTPPIQNGAYKNGTAREMVCSGAGYELDLEMDSPASVVSARLHGIEFTATADDVAAVSNAGDPKPEMRSYNHFRMDVDQGVREGREEQAFSAVDVYVNPRLASTGNGDAVVDLAGHGSVKRVVLDECIPKDGTY